MLDNLFKIIYNNLKYISIILIASSFIMFFYYFLRAIIGLDNMFPFGSNMVDKEIIFVPHFLYMKPITLIVILGYSGFLCGMLHLDKSWGYRWNEYKYAIIEIIVGILLFISVYEVLFNFMLWGALISSITENGIVKGNIDLLANRFPNPLQPWNLVFATKVFYTFSLTLVTAIFFLERWRRLSKQRQ